MERGIIMNKKKITAFVAVILVLVMMVGTTAFAAADGELNIVPSRQGIFVKGEKVDVEVYNINGNNFFKLRDLADVVDFGVDYDEETNSVNIDPEASYVPPVEDVPPVEYNDVPVKTVDLPKTDPSYYAELWAAEVYNFKMIRSLPTLYEEAGWTKYQGLANNLLTYNPDELTDANKTRILETLNAREAMVQVIPFEGINGEVLYIWDEDMPILTENVQEKFDLSHWDNSDFAPYLVPYLVEDQSEAKGTLIIVSGGGNQTRSNAVEGYVVCPAFVEQGYNCFLLQRRVAPYTADEIAMDVQRAIRFVRYYADDWGLGGMDVIGAAGFSGGAGNLRNLINKFYGDITPDQFDTDYICDEIDAMNSDLDVAMFIYGGGTLETENPNIPHIFIAVGEDDSIAEGAIPFYLQLKSGEKQFSKVNPELHIYSQNGHGFGAGIEGTSSILWIDSADLYMQKVMGKAEKAYDGEIPVEYTMTQKVTYQFMNMDVEVTVCIDDTHGKYYIAFVAFNDTQIVEGVLINDRVASVTYDRSGYISRNNDHAKIWELVDQGAWEPIAR